ncbi:MAG: Penicillin-binding protein activator LpoA [Alphaproteobacteria bacterium MarineAlpha6_Bin4]|nr:MAG: Penicillin-binding protein activator LpoA [Alphaproteobacteria bacterium MarineAlpha6_Bin3]PPR38390.1 MAG: Penicillin-binding protein activator LpoA [Alphaproteobacteria bacterium MarineAlpha6_Bin4]|tara:strand:+ start:15612 stop:16982 length:1371 start_codon:yes stop_codon:yes gene_type:complete
MLVKNVPIKLYFKLIFFSFIFFLFINSSVSAGVLTEEELKYIESQNGKDSAEKDYIEYEDLDEKEEEKSPFSFFGIKKKVKKNKIKKEAKVKEKVISDKLKIGVLLPLTGKHSYIGQSLLDTMQMVIFDNKNINSELIIKDTKANPSLAKKLTKELIEQNVDVILGPFFSSSLNQSLKIAKYKNVPLISFSSDRNQKEDGIYLMGFEPEQQIIDVTEHTIKKNYKRYAALLPKSKYGKRVLNTYRKVLNKNKLSINRIELYDPEGIDFEKEIQKLVGLEKNPQIEKDEDTGENPLENFDPGFDVLLLIETGNRLRQAVALLTYYGVDFQKVKLIGTGEWYIDNIGSEPGLVGAWFVAPNPNLWKNFEKKFYKLYKYEPIRLSSLAHDSITAVFSIVKKNDGIKELNYNDFQNSYGFTGIDGNFRFLSNGTVERKLSILEIKQNSFKIEKLAKKKSF